MSYPGKVFVHPRVDTRKVRAGTVHAKTGDAYHRPRVANVAGQHGAPTVPIARVTCPITRTDLGVPNRDAGDGRVGITAPLLGDHGHVGLSQLVGGSSPSGG